MNALVLCSGWIMAALLAGLWWGERGRRIDVFVQNRIPVGKVKPAEVHAQASGTPIATISPEQYADMKKRYVDGLTKEGYSKADAEEDFENMIGAMYNDQPSAA